MRDAVQEKAFLLLDDLARHLDDRALALVERADEPVGARELFGQPRLALHRGALSQLGIIAAVDEQARQIGRAHVRTPVTNAHLVCRLLLAKTNSPHTTTCTTHTLTPS